MLVSVVLVVEHAVEQEPRNGLHYALPIDELLRHDSLHPLLSLSKKTRQ
jgi:hypothetical protein